MSGAFELILNLGTWGHEEAMKAGKRDTPGKKNLTKDDQILEKFPAFRLQGRSRKN